MSNLLLGWPNYSDVGVLETPVLSGGSWLAGLPLSNLQDRRLGRVARSTNAALTSTQFSANLGATNRSVKLVAIPKHTISSVGQMRIRLLNGNFGFLWFSDFSTGWTAVSAPTRTPANVTSTDGIPLDLVGDTNGAALSGYTRVLSSLGTTGQVKVITLRVSKDTSTSSVVRVRDTTAGADRLLAAITWSGTTPVVTMTTGSFIAQYSVGGIWRIVVATTAVTTANTNQLEFYPATTAALATANTGAINASDFEVFAVTTDRLVADSGWFTPWPSGLTIEDVQGLNVAAVYVVTEGVFGFPAGTPAVRQAQVEINDTTNPAGYVDIARLVVAGAYQPTINMSYDVSLGLETATTRSETDSGGALFNKRPMRRTLTGVLEQIPEAEAFASWWRMAKQLGTSEQLFVMYDSADTTLKHERSFLATFRQPSALAQPYLARYQGAFQFVEELP